MPVRASTLAAVLLVAAVCAVPAHAQRTVRVSNAWIQPPGANAVEAVAFAVVDNGTMYDVYVVGVATEVAGAAELRQAVRGGTPAPLKEAMVPAYGQLEMSAEGVQIRLAELKRALKSGETITLSLTLDNGQTLTMEAAVK